MTKIVPIGIAFLLATAAPSVAQTVIVRFDGSYTILNATNCLKIRPGDTGTFRFTPAGLGTGGAPNNTSLAFLTAFGGSSYFKFGTFDVGVTYTLGTGSNPPLPQPVVIPSVSGFNRFDSQVTITTLSAVNAQAVTVIIGGTITNFADAENSGGPTCNVTFSAAAVRRYND